ncbi:type I restriction-modification system subunit M [Bacteroidia bacterium]|nr:type I restriction-modification system subunit M [Bacteroidia bacterium]
MTKDQHFISQTKALIDDLKSVCAAYGLGNDGNEFKIITQIFLYKFLNDKFAYEVKGLEPKLATDKEWTKTLKSYSTDDYTMLTMGLNEGTATLKPEHFIDKLYHQQNENEFAKLLDDTLVDIAQINTDVFSVITDEGSKVVLFEGVTKYVTDKKDAFAKAIINKLVHFSFEETFTEKYDFFATIFEYLIADYNKDSGGKYAEYYTPHAVARIMAACLVPEGEEVNNVTCYDPSAGSGTLLMSLAHAIGESKCTLYSQDISQKSSSLLRLNLILNNLVHSIPNIVQGNTIREPYHREDDGTLTQFDYIVSNPPFKLDFSDYSADLSSKANTDRFFAGIPNVPKKAKDKMAIYPLFIQHIMHTLSTRGRAAIVVPTGFITAQSGIEKRIRERMVTEKMLAGVVSMPSNIFATTGTNVSILFLDKQNNGDVVLIDASNLGTTVKEGKNQKTVLSREEEQRIIDTFNTKKAEDDFSVAVSYEEIAEKNHSLSAGQYFEVKIEYVNITKEEFDSKMSLHKSNLGEMFKESQLLESSIIQNINSLSYE